MGFAHYTEPERLILGGRFGGRPLQDDVLPLGPRILSHGGAAAGTSQTTLSASFNCRGRKCIRAAAHAHSRPPSPPRLDDQEDLGVGRGHEREHRPLAAEPSVASYWCSVLEAGLFERVRKRADFKKTWEQEHDHYYAVDTLLAQSSHTEEKAMVGSSRGNGPRNPTPSRCGRS